MANGEFGLFRRFRAESVARTSETETHSARVFDGTIIVTLLLVWDLIFNVLNVLQGLVPAVVLLRSLIYTFGAVSVTVFFFVFHKKHVVIEGVDAPIFPFVPRHSCDSRAIWH
jgi:hypothetical protein